MRLHADINSLLNISDEFSIPLESSKSSICLKDEHKLNVEVNQQDIWENDCSNFQDSYNLAVRGNFKIPKNILKENPMRPVRVEEIQNKENEKPLKMIPSGR